MSVDYYVAVHQRDWPTAAAIQACLRTRGYPIALRDAPAAPFADPGGSLDLETRFRSGPVQLEASVTRLSPSRSYAYSLDRPPDARIQTPSGEMEITQMRPDDTFTPADINADLRGLGAHVSFGDGDYVLTLSFHSASEETRAGFYLMAAMIYCFNGYGFEFQGPSHGGRSYADGLAADAADAKQWTPVER